MVLLIMMYDLEKASKSAAGISLYVSDDRKVATKNQDQRRRSSLIRMARWYMTEGSSGKLQASSGKLQAAVDKLKDL